jgi:hypothetical protein
MRLEFGQRRSICACDDCQKNCRFVPGYLIPSDLKRMIPPGADPLEWAERNLLASPGAVVSVRDGGLLRVPTLVPATRPDGACIHFNAEGRCDIHGIAPFGCAFFSCKQSREKGNSLSKNGIRAVALALADPASLYCRILEHLQHKQLLSPSPEEKRMRMAVSENHSNRNQR